MSKPEPFEVSYTAYGLTLQMRFQDPQEDGISAQRKVLDYYDAALSSPLDAHARCVIRRGVEVWLDTDWK